ncbi:MAG TPA: TonB-dependent receptor [Longimicrobiaceae bacterium]|jgi:hypothetical protein
MTTLHRHRARRAPARALAAVLAALALCGAGADRARAQTGAPSAQRAQAGTVWGAVVDAASGLPLAGATVLVHRAGGGPGRPGRVALTDSAGVYSLPPLPTGSYRLEVRLMGYHAESVEVDLREAAAFSVSVGMRVEPIVLEPVRVTAAEAQPFGRTRGPAASGTARVAAERLRQRRHLSSDARALTHADVDEAVTLAEPDLFRALQRAPGVSARDDYSAELWTRGAAWDKTAVHFDGVPLFNPLHAVGAFSAVNGDAVGAASFHPGVQPADAAGGAAALLDLRSRRGGEAGRVRVLADASLVSARAAADGPLPGGRGGWMLAGRRTYLDLVSRRVRGRSFPYAFGDVAGRLDLALGGGAALEASFLADGDRLGGEVDGWVVGTRARWGSRAGRATLTLPLLGGRAWQTAGTSDFALRVDAAGGLPGWDPETGVVNTSGSPFRGQATDHAVRYAFLEGGWEREAAPGAASWSAGYRLASHRAEGGTRGLWPYTRGGEARLDGRLALGSVWSRGRWTPLAGLELDAGLRADAGDPIAGSGRLRLAPRLAARWRARPGLDVSASAGRVFQYAQALSPEGPGLNPVALSGALWRVAGPELPAARSDVATLGAESWLAPGVLASATAYLRRTAGLAVPDPTPSAVGSWTVLDPDLLPFSGRRDRPPFVTGDGRARGLELSVRKLSGRYTGSVAYTLSGSEVRAGGFRYPAPWNRDRSLDVTGLARVLPGLRVGGAYTAASGARYTRFHDGVAQCEPGGECGWVVFPQAGLPARERGAPYRSLDLLADLGGTIRGMEVGVYAQLRNASDRGNPAAYVSSDLRHEIGRCRPEPPRDSCEGREMILAGQDSYSLQGLRRTALVGVRMAF